MKGVLPLREESGETKRREAKTVVEEHLHGSQDIGPQEKLQDTVRESRRNSNRGTEEISRKDCEQRRSKGNGAACRELEDLEY